MAHRVGERVTELERDLAGRVVEETRDGARRRYGYDAAGQLTSADDRRFGYDAAGRLVSETGPAGAVEYRYDAAGRLLARRGPEGDTEYGYDGAGRRVRESGGGRVREFTWNALDALTGIGTRGPEGESATALTVDAFGDLAAVDDVGLCWDPTGPLPQLRAVGDTAVLGGDGGPWATVTDGAVRWLDTDWQGSVGTGGDDPWGRAESAGPDLGWRGELTVVGLTWLRHRVYDPATRAFLSPDPWPPVPGAPASANPYHYADNDPVNRVDPLGLRPMTDADLQAYRDAHSGLSLSDLAHGALDVVGMIPVIGEAADLANAGLYLAEGDYTNAALSAAAMIPVIGGAAVAAKYARKGVKAAEEFAPEAIRFSQKSVNAPTTEQLIGSMRREGWNGPPIDVVRMPDGGLTSLDNRRLVATRETGTPVQANVHSHDSPFPPERAGGNLLDKKGNVPGTYGEAVGNRIADQGRAFPGHPPAGSPIPPRPYGEPVPYGGASG